ncbi:SMC family ATPase [Amycolatopsis sp.]|jgi:exonuclease SbcC|uniref:SMC family ATPase n=1 Tax=Amycolatopsis sp. TaxID=37632 RepID=UPI002E07511E|nr:SMC family ATPase [Amycolatopsis sp.]
MRLHKLEVAAFGPYVRREIVDFDVLGADGLFLLHGDTGAGKTTLLDAIAFALFGVVPGARGEVKRLRCEQAEPDDVTEVVLELTVQGHRLRIVRNPEYQRPKRRGEGTTTQQAKASLSWTGEAPDGQPQEGVTRIDEVARTVERLLGMTADQFFQVVLLPQGEFARFLRADTTEREKLLERLFGTGRFGTIERWFADLRTERFREVEDRTKVVRDRVSRFAQVAKAEPPEEEQSEWVSTVLREATAEVAVAEVTEREARGIRERAEAALQENLAAAERIRRVRTAHVKLTELAEQAEQRSLWATEIADAKLATGVVEAAALFDRLDALLDDAERREAGRVRELVATGHESTDAVVADLRAEAGVLREEAGALAGLVAEAEQQRRDRLRQVELGKAAGVAAGQVTVIGEKLSTVPQRVLELREKLAAAIEAEGKLDGVRARADELSVAIRDAEALPAAELAVRKADKALRDAVDEHQLARQHRLDLRERRLNGMAAELAAELADGSACPVCGSGEHPAPAKPVDGSVDEKQERAAEETEQRLDLRRQKLVTAKHEAETKLAGLLEKLGERTAETLAAESAEVRAQLDMLSGLAAKKKPVQSAISSAESEVVSLTKERQDAEKAVTTAETEGRALAELVLEREHRLEVARGEYPDVAARRAHLVDVVTALDALAEARTARTAAQGRVDEQRGVVEEALRHNEFETVELARAAARAQDRVAQLEQQLSAAQVDEARAQSALSEPELFGVSPDDVVDVETAKQAAKEARTRSEAALVAVRGASERARDLDTLAERMGSAMAELAPVEEAYAELKALSEVVNGRGQNARKMSLRSYVLAARLEEVALAATARLRTMSQGRYSFVHSDAAGARGMRGGLGIDVLDDYSGTVRPAKTLSGGESFLASLALALGLADVVAAETGGALLDTLFIDEGFGTLDAETLDIVMNILDELRAGGRVVGLVSHVEELRQRIPTRLRVRKSRSGSTLEVQAG